MSRIDWKTIISDLAAGGYTQPQLAHLCGCGQTTISDLATGKTKQPRYEAGKALLEVHRRALRKVKGRARGQKAEA